MFFQSITPERHQLEKRFIPIRTLVTKCVSGIRAGCSFSHPAVELTQPHPRHSSSVFHRRCAGFPAHSHKLFQAPKNLNPGLSFSVAVSDTAGHENDVVTVRNIELTNIPPFAPFVASLSAAGVSHKPVTLRYLQGSQEIILSHIECRLRDLANLPLLQQLFTQYNLLTSLQLELPWFGPEPLPELSAPTLTHLTIRGGLPYAYQFLIALSAPALRRLEVKFHRSLWDHLQAPHDSSRDHAYSLALSPLRLPSLRTARFEEMEEVPRYSEVSLGCALRPMLSVAALEDVEVWLRASAMWVSDDDATVVARAWPNLHRLVLGSVQVSRGLPTLTALEYLQAGCGNLDELVLPRLDLVHGDVNAKTQPPSQAQDGGVLFPRGMVQCGWGHPLRSLRVACQTRKTVEQEQAIALGRRIDQLFPNLEPDLQFMSAASAELYMSDWYLIWTGIMGAKVARLRQE